MVGKRHASDEITAKLAQARELAAKGKTQREISKALGVSIMTYHRWKKMLNSTDDSAEREWHGEVEPRSQSSADSSPAEKTKRLEQENAQLRRLLTDMLLEKLRLEDQLRARQETRIQRPNKGS